MSSAYNFFIGWFIILGLFYGSLKFEGTKTLTYYVLWLNIVLMLVTHSDTLKTLIEGAVPASPPQGDQSAQQTRGDQTLTGTTQTVPYVQFSSR